MQGGNQSKIIQHRRAQFAGKLMHDVDRVFHQLLRAFDVAVKVLGVEPGSFFQGGQADIDARQSLGDDIVQLAADAFALFLLSLQNLYATDAATVPAWSATVPTARSVVARFA